MGGSAIIIVVTEIAGALIKMETIIKSPLVTLMCVILFTYEITTF